MDNQNYQAPPVQQAQPGYSQPAVDPTTEVLSVGSYIGMFILSAIPIVNIICWIVWLVSPNTNKNKKNYCIATIILWVITMIVYGILIAILAAAGVDLAQYM
ncbi:MAG: hypothetical protein IJI67_02135 [Clostridia bacterium]|nr:hypothetical protein [Clostridia bacterium]